MRVIVNAVVVGAVWKRKGKENKKRKGKEKKLRVAGEQFSTAR